MFIYVYVMSKKSPGDCQEAPFPCEPSPPLAGGPPVGSRHRHRHRHDYTGGHDLDDIHTVIVSMLINHQLSQSPG